MGGKARLASLVLMGLAVQGTAGPLSERYLVVAENGGRTKIFTVRPDGRDWQRLTDLSGQETDAAMSPVHQHVYFRTQLDGDWELGVWDLERREFRRITRTPGLDRQPQVSPDGRWLAFTSERFGNDEILVQDLEHLEQKPRRLTADQGQSSSPSWSPDGAWLAFSSRRNGQADLYRVRLADGEQERLTATDEDEVEPRWNPDGQRLLFQTVTGRHRAGQLGWLDLRDNSRHSFQDLGGSVHHACWSPDGQSLLYLDYRSAFRPTSPALMVWSPTEPQVRPVTIFRSDWDSAHWSYRQPVWVKWPLRPPSMPTPTDSASAPPAP